MNALQQQLKRIGPCYDAVEWAARHNDPLIAWRECPRGDWLLWLVARLRIRRELLVLAACACARLALPFAKDEGPLHAIQMAEQWAGGDPRPSLEQVKVAADAAYVAVVGRVS